MPIISDKHIEPFSAGDVVICCNAKDSGLLLQDYIYIVESVKYNTVRLKTIPGVWDCSRFEFAS